MDSRNWPLDGRAVPRVWDLRPCPAVATVIRLGQEVGLMARLCAPMVLAVAVTNAPAGPRDGDVTVPVCRVPVREGGRDRGP